MTERIHVLEQGSKRLRLDYARWLLLLRDFGPSLGLWRAAEVAALAEREYARPILDFGCGDGFVASLAFGNVEVGLDPWDLAIREARKKGVYERLIKTAIERSGLRSGSFATVISNSVLEHLNNPGAALGAVASLLRPGGKFVFTVPTEVFARWLMLPFQSYSRWRNQCLDHLNLWNVERWREELSRNGLKLEKVRPYLRPALVRVWDTLDFCQQLQIGKYRLASVLWKNLPSPALERIASWCSGLELSAAGEVAGGRLMVACKQH